MPLTNYQESQILKHLFGIATWTANSVLYASLSTTNPDADGQGASEPSGGNYNRVGVSTTLGSGAWTFNANNTVTNGTQIAFGTSTASWGQIQSVPFFDQASGGSIKFYGSLNPSQVIGSSERIAFEPGDIVCFL